MTHGAFTINGGQGLRVSPRSRLLDTALHNVRASHTRLKRHTLCLMFLISELSYGRCVQGRSVAHSHTPVRRSCFTKFDSAKRTERLGIPCGTKIWQRVAGPHIEADTPVGPPPMRQPLSVAAIRLNSLGLHWARFLSLGMILLSLLTCRNHRRTGPSQM